MGYGCIKVHVFPQTILVEIDSLSCYSMSGMELCFLNVNRIENNAVRSYHHVSPPEILFLPSHTVGDQ